jgi:hypothetical protein
LPTPQGEANGLDTIDKQAQLKFRRQRAPKCINASSSDKCISPFDAKPPPCCTFLPKQELGTISPPLLVMHESSLQMQDCASQIDKEHYNMLKRDIDNQDSHKFSTNIANKIDTDI